MPSQTPLDWLYSVQMFGIKLGLEGVTRLLRECGVLYPRARVIHVAGTNGKGSTCAFAESIARAAGYKTGLFTSPHLVSFNERIRVNGEMIADADVDRLIERVRGIIEDWETKPTFFELVLAIAMMYFAEQEVEVIVLETGMGGRLDATNAVPKDVAVICPIGLDHTQYLGHTLYEVAGEKAGIIAWHRPAVTAPQEPEAMRTLHEAAQRMDTDCRIIGGEITDMPLGLRGAYQRRNAALALAALRALPHFLCSQEELARGLAEVQWPGRFEEILPEVIMDGAHNPPAIRVLVQTWRATYGEQKARCVYAGSADKALDEVIELLSPIVGEWILPPVQSPRILPQADMAERVRAHSAVPLRTPATLAEVAEQELRPHTLICGSFFLLGELKALLGHAPYRKTAQ
ncbi:MAG: bifunctional folylpolyglutamate synthase/dihydrofolate synthase [Akkermansia sp.]|nr:bifunctional folylpolyglutamate synthase/dihydrofolate synthase [Akkermansia sp.]